MKLSFRWYGQGDPVPLAYIRQIPNMHSIVTAVYDVPAGDIWSRESIAALKAQVQAAGLHFDVVESVPVHEDIKLGLPSRDTYIANYMENIRRLGEAGVRVICYNFMPVFDWTRSQLAFRLADGSNALAYDSRELEKMDPLSGELALPGWDASYPKEALARLLAQYEALGAQGLWKNLQYFLEAVIPVCAQSGVQMAIHPDDPPWDIFGLPRIIRDEASLDRLLGLVNLPENGLTLCTGSLGCSRENNIPYLTEKYAAMGRIHFMHMRNIRFMPHGFTETAHPSACGSLDMVAIMRALRRNGFHGYLRPDHGRMIWGENGRPGYGLYDRALGAAYLNGIWEALG